DHAAPLVRLADARIRGAARGGLAPPAGNLDAGRGLARIRQGAGRTKMRKTVLAVTAAMSVAAAAGVARAADCDITVGVVMELTGPAGEYGQAGSKSVEMAFRDINDAGGVNGCKLVTDTRDSQSQGTVAVDAATQLVQIKHVPVIIGGIISSVSIPILTSVTAPAKVVQVSPASSSPTLTTL